MKLTITAAESGKLAEARRLLDGISASLKERGETVFFSVTRGLSYGSPGGILQGGGVKYAEFSALCRQEWAGGHGDVTSLSLTDGSLAELEADVLAAPGQLAGDPVLYARVPGVPAPGSPWLGKLLNPVTLSPVKIGAGAPAGMMQIAKLAVLAPGSPT